MRIILLLLCCWPMYLEGQAVVDYPDNSPYTADFIKMGVSPVHEVWTARDYAKAFKLLDRIYQMDKYSMPRYGSQYSHEVFDRLTAFENFDYLLDEKINFGHRVAALEKLRKVPLRILVYYWENEEQKERFGKEVLQCMLVRIHGNRQVKKLYQQLKRQLGGRAEYRELIAQGEAIDNSLIASVDDGIQLLEKKYIRYNQTEIEQFTQDLQSLLPTVWAQLPTVWAKEFKRRLKAIGKKHPYKLVRKICR